MTTSDPTVETSQRKRVNLAPLGRKKSVHKSRIAIEALVDAVELESGGHPFSLNIVKL